MALSALSNSLASSNEYYGKVFQPNTSALRKIALGVTNTAGNQYSNSTEAAKDAGTVFDTGMSGLARAQRGLGVVPTGQTAESQKRRMGLARVIAQVDAGNRAAGGARDAQTAAQEWGAGYYVDETNNGQQVLNDIERREQDRRSQYANAKSAQKASDTSALAGVATIALMAMI